MSDKKPVITIAVDIGTTRTHIGVIDTRELACVRRVDFDNASFAEDQFLSALKTVVSDFGAVGKLRVNITSCVKSLAASVRDICGRESIVGGARIISADTGHAPGVFGKNEIRYKRHGVASQSLLINYDTPQTLGTDRICNAVACAALFKGGSAVMVDVGTAITVDRLHRGKIFNGGAILSGISMQLYALHSGTDSLPSVKIHGGDSDPAGMSTADCIRSGVLYGTAGAIDRIIDEYQKIDGDTRLIITGGDHDIVSGLLRNRMTAIEDLTLIGAGIVADSDAE